MAVNTRLIYLYAAAALHQGGGLRIFYQNGRLREDDKWRQYY